MNDQYEQIAQSVTAISENMFRKWSLRPDDIRFTVYMGEGKYTLVNCDINSIENEVLECFRSDLGDNSITSIECQVAVRSFGESRFHLQKRARKPNTNLDLYDEVLFENGYSLFTRELETYLQRSDEEEIKEYIQKHLPIPHETQNEFLDLSLPNKRILIENIVYLYEDLRHLDNNYQEIAKTSEDYFILGYDIVFANDLHPNFGLNFSVSKLGMIDMLVRSSVNVGQNGLIPIPKETFFADAKTISKFFTVLSFQKFLHKMEQEIVPKPAQKEGEAPSM